MPTTEGNDRSTSPRVTTRVIDTAMMPKNGIVDMKAWYIGKAPKARGLPMT